MLFRSNDQPGTGVKCGCWGAARSPELGASAGHASMPISASSTGGSERLRRPSCGGAEQSQVGSPRGWYPFWNSPPVPRARPGEASFPEPIAICPLLEGPVVSPRQNPAARSGRIQGRRESEAGREGRLWRAGDKQKPQPRALREHRLPAPGLRPTRATGRRQLTAGPATDASGVGISRLQLGPRRSQAS